MIELYKRLLAKKQTKLDTNIRLELEGRTVNPPGYIAQMVEDVEALAYLIAQATEDQEDDAV